MTKKTSKTKMLKVKEVAEAVNVAASTVRWWIREGRFPNAELVETGIGSYWTIPESDIEGVKKAKPGPKPKKSTKGKK